jgi:predicted metal-dependent hydrolase
MSRSLMRYVLAGCAAIAVAGCAGNSRADAGTYRDDLARAEASIVEAQQLGAAERGSVDLSRAREKLDAARRASEEGDKNGAQRLAIEADLDADVAAATARNQEMQFAATELRESIRTLQDELRRNEQRRLGRL